MSRKLRIFYSVSLMLMVSLARVGQAANENVIVSPNGQVQARVFLQGGQLSYAVTFRTKPVIEVSPIRITIAGQDLTSNVAVSLTQPYQVQESFPWYGSHALATNHCNGATIALRDLKSNTSYTLDVRAYNDGMAFRYSVPGNDQARVPDETTAFLIPAGSVVWHHNLRGHYEGNHSRNDVATIAAGEWAAPPLTYKLPDGAGYASITEANLVNYPGMALQADGQRGFNIGLGHKHPISYPFELRYKEDIERVSKPAAMTGTITSPWRVVLIGPDLNTLVNSDIIPSLCPPPDKALFPDGIKTGWVKPGRAVWAYLDGGARTLEGAKEFCKMAGQLGFQYNVIEGYWEKWSDAEIKDMVAYAAQQGVGIWVWKHSKQLRDATVRHQFFQRCHDLGVVGVKIDFFDNEAKELIDLYQAILRETAESHLMVNFHGSNKPTGEARTWPNELTREAVHGMEGRMTTPGQRALHDVTLPFTRYLAGPADYTPVHFGARRADTSWAHQIASGAIFTSPLLTYAANPTNLLSNPAVDLIKSIPSVWDETVVLPPSEIGEVAIFARRTGTTWFLAVMNGTTARTINLPLSFLAAGSYHAMLVRDDKNDGGAVQIEHTTEKRSNSLSIDLRSGGGFIARFTQE
ncbi:MAG: glycoside hydrolase family 97 catalytic domain-containing protein [Abitibacteriaceae bacterium]|nr:glycoside hydrolase family 97 catalytic domain-containing protein [Abditibacteriaceae bacterium]